MTDRAYIISRALEHKIAIAENNDQNTLLVTLDVLKEQEQEIAFLKEMQLQTIGNMSEEDIGNLVAKNLGIKGWRNK